MYANKSYDRKYKEYTLHYLTPELGLASKDIIYSIISCNFRKHTRHRNKMHNVVTEGSQGSNIKSSKLPPINSSFVRHTNHSFKTQCAKPNNKPAHIANNTSLLLSKQISRSLTKSNCSHYTATHKTNPKITYLYNSIKKNQSPDINYVQRIPDSESEREMENNAIINQYKGNLKYR